MGSFSSFDISASGIHAQRTRMDVIANNIANADSTRTAEGGPYRRQRVVFRTAYEQSVGNRSVSAGVQVEGVVEDPTDYRTIYDPGHPGGTAFLSFVNAWIELAGMLNELSRSMGQPDFYPFVLPPAVIAKLHFIHLVIQQEGGRADEVVLL